MKSMVNQLKVIREGAYVIVISKQLDSPFFPVAFSGLYKMSWGQCRVYVHQKAPPPRKLNLDEHWGGNQNKLSKLLLARPKRRLVRDVKDMTVNIADAHPNEGVTIENCSDSTIIIPGKVAAINILKCTRINVRISIVIATAEIISCQNCTFAFEDCAMYHLHHVTASKIEAVKSIVQQRPQGAGGWLCVSSECKDVQVLLKRSSDPEEQALQHYTIPSSFAASATLTTSEAGTDSSQPVQQSGQIKTNFDVTTASFVSTELLRNKFGYIDWLTTQPVATLSSASTDRPMPGQPVSLDVFHV